MCQYAEAFCRSVTIREILQKQKIEFVKFHTFGGKKQKKHGDLKIARKKCRNFGGKKVEHFFFCFFYRCVKFNELVFVFAYIWRISRIVIERLRVLIHISNYFQI